MKIKKTKDGWLIRKILPFEWIPHRHFYILVGEGFLGNTIKACRWCGKEKRGLDFKF